MDVAHGQTVLFTLERRIGEGAWQAMGSVQATVSGTSARATARVEHPGGLDDVHYRFRARLI